MDADEYTVSDETDGEYSIGYSTSDVCETCPWRREEEEDDDSTDSLSDNDTDIEFCHSMPDEEDLSSIETSDDVTLIPTEPRPPRDLNPPPTPLEEEEAWMRAEEATKLEAELKKSIEQTFRSPAKVRAMLRLLPEVDPHSPMFSSFFDV